MIRNFEWRSRFPFVSPRFKEILGLADPLEVLFLLAFGMSSIVQGLNREVPSSVETILPPAARSVWLVILGLGSFVAIIGIFWPGKKSDALLVESVGLGWVSLMIIGYGVMQLLAAYFNDRLGQNFMSGLMVLILGLAFGLKQRRIQAVIDRLKE